MLVNIINQLFEYSNHYIEIRTDPALPMPAFSIIEKNIYGRFVPIIIMNDKVLTEEKEVMAHILAHEWGHHVLNHIELVRENNKPSHTERQNKENEADAYAAGFIKEFCYSKEPIKKFLKEHPHDLENRLNILESI